MSRQWSSDKIGPHVYEYVCPTTRTMDDWHEQCAGGQIVLDRMKLANAGWFTRIQAERLLDEYFARIETVVIERCPAKGWI
jgi:hypothetical protein